MIPPLPHASSLPSPALSPCPLSSSSPFFAQHAKCAACHGPLEPPTISFLCLHSYHPACLGDYDTECLVCTPQRKRIAEHLTQQRALARGKEDFFLMEVVKQSGGGGQGDGFARLRIWWEGAVGGCGG